MNRKETFLNRDHFKGMKPDVEKKIQLKYFFKN